MPMDEKEPDRENTGAKSAPPEEWAGAKALRLVIPDREPESWERQVAGAAGRGRAQGSYFNSRGKPLRIRSRGR